MSPLTSRKLSLLSLLARRTSKTQRMGKETKVRPCITQGMRRGLRIQLTKPNKCLNHKGTSQVLLQQLEPKVKKDYSRAQCWKIAPVQWQGFRVEMTTCFKKTCIKLDLKKGCSGSRTKISVLLMQKEVMEALWPSILLNPHNLLQSPLPLQEFHQWALKVVTFIEINKCHIDKTHLQFK